MIKIPELALALFDAYYGRVNMKNTTPSRKIVGGLYRSSSNDSQACRFLQDRICAGWIVHVIVEGQPYGCAASSRVPISSYSASVNIVGVGVATQALEGQPTIAHRPVGTYTLSGLMAVTVIGRAPFLQMDPFGRTSADQ